MEAGSGYGGSARPNGRSSSSSRGVSRASRPPPPESRWDSSRGAGGGYPAESRRNTGSSTNVPPRQMPQQQYASASTSSQRTTGTPALDPQFLQYQQQHQQRVQLQQSQRAAPRTFKPADHRMKGSNRANPVGGDNGSVDEENNKFSWPKIVAIIIGLILLIGAIVGIAHLVHFLKANRIKLTPMAMGASTGAPAATYTSAELATHNTANSDCWVAYYGNIYDMSNYAGRIHPGGPTWINPLCGYDGTQSFSKFHPQGLLKSISGADLIGALSATATSAPGGSGSSTATTSAPGGSGSSTATTTGGTSPPAGSSSGGGSSSSSGITSSQLAQHSSANSDCWVAFHGKVYDMSSYPSSGHPGGASWINQQCGQDGTSAFSQFHPASFLNNIPGDLVGTFA